MSNLLSVGFQKLVIDLYWDTGRRAWSFCPVALPDAVDLPGQETVVVNLDQPSSTMTVPVSTSVTDGSVSTPTTTQRPSQLSRKELDRRQFDGISSAGNGRQIRSTSTTTVSKATLTVDLATSGREAFASLPTSAPSDAQEILYAVGPYTCSGTRALDILTDLLMSYLRVTDDTLQGMMLYIIFNIHASASIAAPSSPALAPSQEQLPQQNELIGQYLRNNDSDFLYTPRQLYEERLNLTRTWLDPEYMTTAPLSAYFANVTNGHFEQTTDDGWPSTSYTEFRRANHLRLLLGHGRADPQMAGYDFETDGGLVFPQGYLDDVREISQTVEGLSSGCIYNRENSSLTAANNSWATTAVDEGTVGADLSLGTNGGFQQYLLSVTNLTACGYSPFLNNTLGDQSALTNVAAYRTFSLSSTWSWAWGEPRTARNLTLANGASEGSLRCAVLDPINPGGHWRVAQCNDTYVGACRLGQEPLGWTISTQEGNYTEVGQYCPSNSSFSTPRTALENRYLLEAYRTSADDPDELQPLFINLNSRDVPNCWVTGVNNTCPYDLQTDSARQIYIPAIAGVVILIVTVLLIIVKCSANRSHSRRRRKGDNGWDYEGVPS